MWNWTSFLVFPPFFVLIESTHVPILDVLEKFEDSKWAIRSRKSKDKQHNGRKKKDKQHNGRKKKDKQHNGRKKKDKETNNYL